MRRARQVLESIAFTTLGTIVRRAPRRLARKLATAMGHFAFDVLRLRRRVAVENVRLRLRPPGGEREAVRIARASYGQLGRTFVDLLRFDRVDDDAVWKEVDRDEVERVAALARRPGGCLLVSAHFGNWELLLHALARVGLPISVIAGDQSNARVDRAVKGLRLAGGVPTRSARREVRAAMRDLLEGRAVATLMDQDARHKGVFVEFLGAPASTHVGVVRMALGTGAAFVPVLFAEEGGKHRAHLAPPWVPPVGASLEERLRDGAAYYTRFLEEHVRRRPEEYLWAHRRWKTKPPA